MEKHVDRTSSGLEQGLIKLEFSYKSIPRAELALVMSRSLADCVGLPNDVLYYRDFLRSGMREAWEGGMNVSGPFAGLTVTKQDIIEVKGRVFYLGPAFGERFKLLIGCNSSYFRDAITEMKRTLADAGFSVDARNWEEYKSWEAEKLKAI